MQRLFLTLLLPSTTIRGVGKGLATALYLASPALVLCLVNKGADVHCFKNEITIIYNFSLSFHKVKISCVQGQLKLFYILAIQSDRLGNIFTHCAGDAC